MLKQWTAFLTHILVGTSQATEIQQRGEFLIRRRGRRWRGKIDCTSHRSLGLFGLMDESDQRTIEDSDSRFDLETGCANSCHDCWVTREWLYPSSPLALLSSHISSCRSSRQLLIPHIKTVFRIYTSSFISKYSIIHYEHNIRNILSTTVLAITTQCSHIPLRN